MSPDLSQIKINKIKSIVDQEFDTEILFKHKDLDAVEKEIGKAESQLTLLKKYYEDKAQEEAKQEKSNKKGKKKTVSPKPQKSEEPNRYSKKYTQLLSILATGQFNSFAGIDTSQSILAKKKKQENIYSPISSGYMTTRSQSSSLRPVARMRPSTNSVEFRYQQQQKCICRRSDNVLVSLACPKCAKTDFLSPQGFINHCRIAHMIDILSHDHAAMTCGTLLPKEEQDDDGLAALENLEKHGLDPSVNLNKPDLEEYAKTNKRDPLATIQMDKINDTSSNTSQSSNHQRKSSLALSPTTPFPIELIGNINTNSEFKVSKPKKVFTPRFSHLKKLYGDKISEFDSLVTKTTEKVEDVDIGEDEVDDEVDESDKKRRVSNKSGRAVK